MMNECDDLMQVECQCGAISTLEGYLDHVCPQPEPEPSDFPVSSCQASKISNCSGEASNENAALDSDSKLIGQLAEAVHARPALWDHTLPLKVRGKDVKERLWREVHKELKGQIPLPQLEKKWRNLRDTVLKHLKTYTPSGSGATKKKWIHFDVLFFLAEKSMPRKTYSNVEGIIKDGPSTVSPGPSSHGSISAEETEIEGAPLRKCRKKSVSDESERLLLNILKEPPPNPTTSVSPALLVVQSLLDKLPTRVKMQAEIDLINKAYQLYNEFVDE